MSSANSPMIEFVLEFLGRAIKTKVRVIDAHAVSDHSPFDSDSLVNDSVDFRSE